MSIDAFLLDHLAARAPASADPVEVARAFQAASDPGNPDPEAWHRHLSAVKRAALRLAGEGQVEILRKGKVVPVDQARGVIRLRQPAPATAPAVSCG